MDEQTEVIAVEPRATEYWDNRGTNGLEHLFQAASSLVTNTHPEVQEGEQHGRLPALLSLMYREPFRDEGAEGHRGTGGAG